MIFEAEAFRMGPFYMVDPPLRRYLVRLSLQPSSR